MRVWTAIVLMLAAAACSSENGFRLVDSVPENGQALRIRPERLALCFSEPLRSEQSSDYSFGVFTPDNLALGLRTVFAEDGKCVGIEPGLPPASPPGEWSFDWQVVSSESGTPAAGEVIFTVDPTASTEGDSLLPVFLVGAAAAATTFAAGGILMFLRRRAARR
ncbi:MAG: copper resistance CopC family protein [Gammaproteobacteria bacterium]